jgi:hypothetical protein
MNGPRCRRAHAIVNPWAGRFTRIQPNLRRDATPYGTSASRFEAGARGWTKTPPELGDGEDAGAVQPLLPALAARLYAWLAEQNKPK